MGTLAPLWQQMPGHRIGDAVRRQRRTRLPHGNRGNRGERADPLQSAWRITATRGANFPGFPPAGKIMEKAQPMSTGTIASPNSDAPENLKQIYEAALGELRGEESGDKKANTPIYRR